MVSESPADPSLLERSQLKTTSWGHLLIIKGSQGYKCESAEKRLTRPSAPSELCLCLFQEALIGVGDSECFRWLYPLPSTENGHAEAM
jgi:hypothetical protein